MKIISLGLGVQSTALYFMSSMGQLPRADYAIFVDLGREKRKTMEYLDFIQKWQGENRGIEIMVVRKKDLFKDLLNSVNSTNQRFSSIPAFTENQDGSVGMLRRQCTNEYKIEQVDKEIRELLSVSRIINQKVEVWKGISLEEVERISIPQTKWKIHVYPFCGYKVSKRNSERIEGSQMTRTDIIQWFKEHNLPIPPKSSCVFCPYQSDAAWAHMKENEPKDFEDAIQVDKAIRNSSKKGILNPIYLHRSCVPLEVIKFENRNSDLFDQWNGECSGSCHI